MAQDRLTHWCHGEDERPPVPLFESVTQLIQSLEYEGPNRLLPCIHRVDEQGFPVGFFDRSIKLRQDLSRRSPHGPLDQCSRSNSDELLGETLHHRFEEVAGIGHNDMKCKAIFELEGQAEALQFFFHFPTERLGIDVPRLGFRWPRWIHVFFNSAMASWTLRMSRTAGWSPNQMSLLR